MMRRRSIESISTPSKAQTHDRLVSTASKEDRKQRAETAEPAHGRSIVYGMDAPVGRRGLPDAKLMNVATSDVEMVTGTDFL